MNLVLRNREGFAARYHEARDKGCPAVSGRPTRYSTELAERLCRELATGRTMSDVCRDPGMPADRTVHDWVAKDYKGFTKIYKQAREAGCYAMGDQIIDIADDVSGDLIVRQARDGSFVTVPNPENIKRAQLRCSSRKWLISKMAPKQFGDRPEPVLTEPPRDTLAEVLKEIEGRTRGLPSTHRPIKSDEDDI
jgi:hypothetical protein